MENESTVREFIEVFHDFKRNGLRDKMPMQVKGSEMMVLHYLARQRQYQGSAPRQTELSSFMNLSPSTVTPLLNALEEKGYVVRNHSEYDRRVVYVDLTQAGSEFLNRIHDEMTKIVGGLVSFLGQEDSKQFIRLMKKATEYFRMQPNQFEKSEAYNVKNPQEP